MSGGERAWNVRLAGFTSRAGAKVPSMRHNLQSQQAMLA